MNPHYPRDCIYCKLQQQTPCTVPPSKITPLLFRYLYTTNLWTKGEKPPRYNKEDDDPQEILSIVEFILTLPKTAETEARISAWILNQTCVPRFRAPQSNRVELLFLVGRVASAVRKTTVVFTSKPSMDYCRNDFLRYEKEIWEAVQELGQKVNDRYLQAP